MIERLIVIAAIGTALCRMMTGQWPWAYLKARSARDDRLNRARKLLGTRAAAGREEIIEAHKRLVAIVHPDRGGTSEQVHEANAARDLLLDELP